MVCFHLMQNAELTALLEAAFGGASHPIADWLAGRLSASPALRAFVAANATKIRKKVRHATGGEEQRDLRCELAVAAALADRRSSLSYEPLAAEGGRGPDFLLRHKGHLPLYVEVSRLRPRRGPAGAADAQPQRDPAERLAAVLCGKLGQLAPGAANLLVLVSDAGPYGAAEVEAALQGLRRRAGAGDDAYFAFRGLEGTRAFNQAIPRLSAVLVVAPAAAAEALYLHAQARHPLPAELARAAAAWGLAAQIGPAPEG